MLYIGFSYIILSHRVFLMFGLHRVFLVSARMRKETLEKTLVYAYPCHQPHSTPNTIGPRGTSWRVATSGVHAMAFLVPIVKRGLGG